MNEHPLSRCAASPLKGGDALCCGAALAGHPFYSAASVLSAVGDAYVLESWDE